MRNHWPKVLTCGIIVVLLVVWGPAASSDDEPGAGRYYLLTGDLVLLRVRQAGEDAYAVETLSSESMGIEYSWSRWESAGQFRLGHRLPADPFADNRFRPLTVHPGEPPVIFSFGPDRDQAAYEAGFVDTGSLMPAMRVQFQPPYDPTNGTISAGNLYYRP